MGDKDKLVLAVVFLGRNGMESISERNGRRRAVHITWHARELSDVPPADWSDQVKQELDFQDSNPMPPGML